MWRKKIRWEGRREEWWKGKKGRKWGRLEVMEVGTGKRDRSWQKRFRPPRKIPRNVPLYVLTAKKITSRTFRTCGTLIVKCVARGVTAFPAVSRYRRVCRICSWTKTNAIALYQSHMVDVFASVNGDKHFFQISSACNTALLLVLCSNYCTLGKNFRAVEI